MSFGRSVQLPAIEQMFANCADGPIGGRPRYAPSSPNVLTVACDASVLYGHLTRAEPDPGWVRLCQMARQDRVRIALSEVTLVELTARLERRISKLRIAAERATKALSCLDSSVASTANVRSAGQVAAEAVAELESDVRDTPSGLILPAPDVDHLELARRAASRHRPFDDKGSGYRDSLLWLSALEIARSGSDVILVSADKPAFGESGVLSDSLATEAHEVSGRDRAVRLVETLDAAWREAAMRGDEAAASLREMMESDADLHWDMFKAIVLAARDLTLVGRDLHRGRWPDSITGVKLDPILQPARLHARHAIPINASLFRAEVQTQIEVGVDMRAEELAEDVLDNVPWRELDDLGYALDPYLHISGRVEVEIRATLDVDTSSGAVMAASIERVLVPLPDVPESQTSLGLS